MTKKEEKEEEHKKEMWSMDDLISLTQEIQIADILFKNKIVGVQYCELVEKEEPSISVNESLSQEEKDAYYMEVGVGRVKAMLDKANNMNPEGATVTSDNWGKLPSTLRFMIANEIMGIETDISENFTIG